VQEMQGQAGGFPVLPPGPHAVRHMRARIPNPWGGWPAGCGNRRNSLPLDLHHLRL